MLKKPKVSLSEEALNLLRDEAESVAADAILHKPDPEVFETCIAKLAVFSNAVIDHFIHPTDATVGALAETKTTLTSDPYYLSNADLLTAQSRIEKLVETKLKSFQGLDPEEVKRECYGAAVKAIHALSEKPKDGVIVADERLQKPGNYKDYYKALLKLSNLLVDSALDPANRQLVPKIRAAREALRAEIPDADDVLTKLESGIRLSASAAKRQFEQSMDSGYIG